MSKLIDMTGRKIGRLTVLSYSGSKFRGRSAKASWHCRCDCGRRLVVVGAKLREGQESCGCLSRFTPERAKLISQQASARRASATKPER
jgi:hypothetical protein